LKTSKRILSVLLVLAMCVSLLASFASAEETGEKPVYKVVSIGDSTCVGHGLPDFGAHSMVTYLTSPEYSLYPWGYEYGFLDCRSDSAYTVLLCDYLQEKLPDYKVEHTNLGISGLRAQEIRAILDTDFEGDYLTQRKFTDTNILGALKYYYDLSAWDNDLHTLFVEEIKSADLITLDCIMNSFTDYLSSRALAVLEQDEEKMTKYDDSVSDIADELMPGAKALIDIIAEDFVRAYGDKLPDEIVTGLVDTAVYCLSDLCISFSKLVSIIRDLNPAARILVGGAYNPVDGMSIVYSGVRIDAGHILSALADFVNTYITNIEPNRLYYTFIDCPEDIETGRAYLASLDSCEQLPVETLNRYIDEIFGYDHSALATPLCNTAQKIAAEKGMLEGTHFSDIWPADVASYFADVRENGENAGNQSKVFVEAFGNVIDLIIQSMHVRSVDIDDAMEAFSAEFYSTMLKYSDKSFDELTDAEKVEIFVVSEKEFCFGFCAHFSEKGCQQKYIAAVRAYNSALPTIVSRGPVERLIKDAITGLICTLWEPMLRVMGDFLGDLTADYAPTPGLFPSVLQFLVRIFT